MPESWVATPASRHLRGRRSRDTQPEILLRQALHRLGARFRLQRRLAAGCSVDVLLPRHRIAVFIDGDFWHGCPEHGRLTGFNGPNAELWEAKIRRTQERDERATAVAASAGWTVVRLWECEVRADPDAAARRVLGASCENASGRGPGLAPPARARPRLTGRH